MRQGGSLLTHSVRTLPAVHPGIVRGRNKKEGKRKKEKIMPSLMAYVRPRTHAQRRAHALRSDQLIQALLMLVDQWLSPKIL